MTHRFTHKLMTRVKNWPGAYYTNWKLPYHTEKDPTKAHKTRKPNPRRSKMFIDKTKRNISKKRNSLQKNPPSHCDGSEVKTQSQDQRISYKVQSPTR